MKRSLAFLITFIVLALAGPAAAKPSVAILGLEVTDTGAASGGVDAKGTQFAATLTEVLRQRAKIASGPFSLAPGSDKDLIEMKLLSGCDDEGNECMAAIGAELAADRLLYGHVEKQARGYQVSLKLLNVASKRTEFSISDLIPYTETSGRALDGWGKTLYAKVTGASNQGTLIVKANVERGAVYLDGVVRGNISGGTARITGLDAGDYALVVESDCYLRSESRIAVEGGKDTQVPVDLEKNTLADCGGTRPPGPTAVVTPGGTRTTRGDVSTTASPGKGYRVLFWTTAAVTAGAGATWGYAYFGKIGPNEDKWNAAGGPPTETCQDSAFYDTSADGRAACDEGRKWSKVTYAAIPITAAAGAAAMYFFYKGYVSTPGPQSQERIVRKRGRKPAMAVAPVVTARELGGVVHIEFSPRSLANAVPVPVPDLGHALVRLLAAAAASRGHDRREVRLLLPLAAAATSRPRAAGPAPAAGLLAAARDHPQAQPVEVELADRRRVAPPGGRDGRVLAAARLHQARALQHP